MLDSNKSEGAPIQSWLAMPMEPSVRSAIDRVRHADDVIHVAVMPDVHLANDVCIGTVMATCRLAYPAAVGGDIGCGMLAMALDAEASPFHDPARAGQLLRLLGESIPIHHHHRSRTLPLPGYLKACLSHGALVGTLKDIGLLQLGTLGGGNHFIELQSGPDNRLWLMIHSGSRAMGQAIKNHHVANATIRSASMKAVDIETPSGQAYMIDQQWARDYARENRAAMALQVCQIFRESYKIDAVESMAVDCDHNHLAREEHSGQSLLVHRKGAISADDGRAGIVPGSMGTLSYHVIGRGCELALRSGAHGAGRLYSRHAARQRFNRQDLQRQMEGVWFDTRLVDELREESPKSYKDIRRVMQAQEELVRVERMVRPLLVYKGAK